MLSHILSVGADPSLLYTRDLVLQSTGASVRSAAFTQAMLLLRDYEFNVLILCHSLNEREVGLLCKYAHRTPVSTKVLLIESVGPIPYPEAWIDCRFAFEGGPRMLLQAVSHLLDASLSSCQGGAEHACVVTPLAARSNFEQARLLTPLTLKANG
jgi:hypothetical protein